MFSQEQCILLIVVSHLLLPCIDSFQRPLGGNNIFPWRLHQPLHSTTRRYSVPILDEWKMLPNGRIEGKVSNHPNIEDGAIISTSPASMTSDAENGNGVGVIETKSGSLYLLRNPSSSSSSSMGAISGLNVDYSADFPGMDSTTTNTMKNNEKIATQEETNETKKLMQKVKDAGVAGIISYAFWELGFWAVSVPVCIAAYRQVTGHWPDFSNQEDLKQLGAEAFAFVNVARFAVPLRIGLALSTTPWIQTNIVDRFSSSSKKDT